MRIFQAEIPLLSDEKQIGKTVFLSREEAEKALEKKMRKEDERVNRMSEKEIKEILAKHKLWLGNKKGGVKANLRGADLHGADLHGANLQGANLWGANLWGANLHEADLHGADLHGADLREADLWRANLREADLREANLRGADLREANLQGADLDYSCLPLWCGSLSAKFDDKQLKQIAYHLVKAGLQSKNASDETKTELAKIIDFANEFQRANECGKIAIPTEKGGERE